jgi:hypothetical protein
VRVARLAAIVALAAGAVLLALLAHDVRAWPSAFEQGDVHAQAGAPTHWTPSTALPSGWSEGLLGVEPARALRLAIRRFRATYDTPPGFDSGLAAVEARDEAEAALAARASDADGRRASQALDLLGLMLFGDSSAGGGTAAAIRSEDDLAQAVRLDGGNDAAKTNLELVLRLLETHGTRIGPNAGAGPRSTGHKGAGTGVAGEGY